MPTVREYAFLTDTSEGPAWVPVGGGPLLPYVETDGTDGGGTPGEVVPVLLVSQRSSRETPVPLDGAELGVPLAVFIDEPGIRSVTFDKGLASERTANTAPYDYKGGTGTDAVLWSPADGTYTVTADVTFTDASRDPASVSATFTVMTVTTPTNPALAAPVLGVPTTSGASVSLSWSAVSGATGYRLYRSGSLRAEQAGTTFTDTTVVPGITYSYTVHAYDAVGQGPASNARTVTPTGTGGGQQPGVFQPSETNVGHGTGGYTSVLSPMSGGTFPAGTVLRDKLITGQVHFSGPGCEMVNCHQRYTGTGAAVTSANDAGARIERCTLEAPNGVGYSTREGTHVRYCKITAGKDGIKAWHYSLYESNWIYMARPAGSTTHSDGIQGEGKTNWTARGNFIDIDHARGGNFAIFCQGFNGTEDKDVYDVLIEDNWVSCGNAATATGDGKTSTGRLHNVVIRRNRYARRGRYYPRVHQQQSDTRFDRMTNVWDDDGTPILTADGQPNP